MSFCLEYFFGRRVSLGKKKGVSEVIATILMVMVTVMLVFFANKFFTDFAHTATNTADNAQIDFQKQNQKIMIPTAYCCGSYICFEVKASGTNNLDLPTEKSGYYINNVPKKVYPWGSGDMGPNCVDNPVLSPGDNCLGKVNGPCNGDIILKVVLPWNIQGYRAVSK
jgi:flagellin-like protein